MITIVYSRLVGGFIESGGGQEPWLCWLELTQDDTTWMLPTTAPGSLAEEQLQAYFDEQEDYLWVLANRRQHAPKLCGNVPTAELVRPLLLALLDELNFIRENPGTHLPLTEGDILTSVKNYLGGN